jgi:cardiolipin synthase
LQRAHSVELLPAGERAWRSIAASIEAARESIHLEFYIWRDDEAGRALTDLLTRRAAQGVRVRVIVDALGSFGLPASHLAGLVAAGGEVATFAPIWLPSLQPRANFRNHRKLICVDQRVGFVGGLNVGSEYLGFATGVGVWQDLLVRIEGQAVDALETLFAGDWLEARGDALDEDPGARERVDIEDDSGGALVQIIPSGPDVQHAYAIAAQFTAAIGSSLERCWIATPYLIPDEPLMLALKTAALRGVDLRLLVPGKSDLRLVHLASRSYYDELLAAGCQIFELPQMLHSKYLIVDDTLSAIGSANMDIRSFYLNYEVTAMFYDADVTAGLARIFGRDLAGARPIRIQDRARVTGSRQLAESAARVMSPLL